MVFDPERIVARILSVRLGGLVEDAKANWDAVSQSVPEGMSPYELERMMHESANASTHFLEQISDSPSLFGVEEVVEKAIGRTFPRMGENDILINVGDKGAAGTYYLFESKSLDDIKGLFDSAVVGETMMASKLDRIAYKLSGVYDLH